jgi:hypothetical protein
MAPKMSAAMRAVLLSLFLALAACGGEPSPPVLTYPVREIPVGREPCRILVLDDGASLVTTNLDDNTISLVSLVAGRETARLVLPVRTEGADGPTYGHLEGLAADPEERRLYVTTNEGQVFQVDRATREHRVLFDDPRYDLQVAVYDAARDRLLVGGEDEEEKTFGIYEVGEGSLTLIAATPHCPFHVGIHGDELRLSGCDSMIWRDGQKASAVGTVDLAAGRLKSYRLLPRGIAGELAIDAEGRTFVADHGVDRILAFSPDWARVGERPTWRFGEPYGDGAVSPWHLALTESGLLVGELGESSDRVLEYGRDGGHLSQWPVREYPHPPAALGDIAALPGGWLAMTSYRENVVRLVSPDEARPFSGFGEVPPPPARPAESRGPGEVPEIDVGEIRVGRSPDTLLLAPDNRRLFVTNRGHEGDALLDTVSIIDLEKGEETLRIRFPVTARRSGRATVGRLGALALEGSTLYAAGSTGEVFAVDLAAPRIGARVLHSSEDHDFTGVLWDGLHRRLLVAGTDEDCSEDAFWVVGEGGLDKVFDLWFRPNAMHLRGSLLRYLGSERGVGPEWCPGLGVLDLAAGESESLIESTGAGPVDLSVTTDGWSFLADAYGRSLVALCPDHSDGLTRRLCDFWESDETEAPVPQHVAADRSRVLLAVEGRVLEYAVRANGLSDHPVREHDLAGVGPITDLVLLPGGLFAVVAPRRGAVFVLGR